MVDAGLIGITAVAFYKAAMRFAGVRRPRGTEYRCIPLVRVNFEPPVCAGWTSAAQVL